LDSQENKPHVFSTKPPKGLMVLLILTWINTLFSMLSTLFTLIFVRPKPEDLAKDKVEMAKSIVELKKLGLDSVVNLLERIQAMTEALQPFFIELNLVNLLVLMVGAVSALLMYRRNILGFHLYIVYNLASVGSIYLFVSPSVVPSIIIIVNSAFSLLFVLLYARHLTWLKAED
jgi:hypothetical protein